MTSRHKSQVIHKQFPKDRVVPLSNGCLMAYKSHPLTSPGMILQEHLPAKTTLLVMIQFVVDSGSVWYIIKLIQITHFGGNKNNAECMVIFQCIVWVSIKK